MNKICSLDDDNFANMWSKAVSSAEGQAGISIDSENEYFLENFGLQCACLSLRTGDATNFVEFEIVDEKKYTEFLLRYS